ncbi:MAG: putative endonuclease [Polaribacter sp.]
MEKNINESVKNWFLYVILCSDERLYTGITTNINRRWRQHCGDLKNGAKFFRGRKPKKLLFVESFEDRSTASKREYAIKKLTRVNKLLLITTEINLVKEFKLNNK